MILEHIVKINNFYRYNSGLINDLDSMVKRNQFKAELDVMATLRIGDGLLLAQWNDMTKQGQVFFIGVVTGGIDPDTETLPVVWSAKRFNVCPNPGGYQFWRKNFFKFAKAPAERYGLKQKFEDLNFLKGQEGPASMAAPDSSGYIYVLKSDYGYKIGKTKSLKSRTQLFGVKLPFDFSIAFTFFSEKFSQLEVDLHQLFRERRVNGEWFELEEQDLIRLENYCKKY